MRRLLICKTAAGIILLESLWLSLARPVLMANLYLLTYAGLAQLAPANILSCTRSTFINEKGLIAGLVVGEAIVIGYNIAGSTRWGMNNGIPALVVILAVMVEVSVVTGKAEHAEFLEMSTHRTPVRIVAPVSLGTAGQVGRPRRKATMTVTIPTTPTTAPTAIQFLADLAAGRLHHEP